mmetsp:Transcript_23045/g.65333  ORF Transcript_23045/g.65333 Transcript_23045/m.65333 type:complete len:358 (+) Transcript_23045:751-1824(+)
MVHCHLNQVRRDLLWPRIPQRPRILDLAPVWGGGGRRRSAVLGEVHELGLRGARARLVAQRAGKLHVVGRPVGLGARAAQAQEPRELQRRVLQVVPPRAEAPAPGGHHGELGVADLPADPGAVLLAQPALHPSRDLGALEPRQLPEQPEGQHPADRLQVVAGASHPAAGGADGVEVHATPVRPLGLAAGVASRRSEVHEVRPLVQDAIPSWAVHQDVVGLDVAVDEAVSVDSLQSSHQQPAQRPQDPPPGPQAQALDALKDRGQRAREHLGGGVRVPAEVAAAAHSRHPEALLVRLVAPPLQSLQRLQLCVLGGVLQSDPGSFWCSCVLGRIYGTASFALTCPPQDEVPVVEGVIRG